MFPNEARSMAERDDDKLREMVVTLLDEKSRNSFNIQPEPETESSSVLNIKNKQRLDIEWNKYHKYRISNFERRSKKSLQCTDHTTIEHLGEAPGLVDWFIISDTHIGYQHRDDHSAEYEFGRERWSFEVICSNAIKHDIDTIFHAGDIYDNDWKKEDHRLVINNIKRLKQNNIEFAFVEGNHDKENASKELSELCSYSNVHHLGGLEEPYTKHGFDIMGFDYGEIDTVDQLRDSVVTSRDNTAVVLLHPANIDPVDDDIHEVLEAGANDLNIYLGHRHYGKVVRHPPSGSVTDSRAVFLAPPFREGPGPSIERFTGISEEYDRNR